MNPLTIKHLWVIVIVAALFGLALLWDKTITALLVSKTSYSLAILLTDSIVKTAVIGIIGLVVVYKAKVSEPFNNDLDKIRSFKWNS